MTSPIRGAPPQPGGGKRKGKAQYVQAKRARRGPGGGPRQLAPAMQGILITCNMNERKCVEEAYSLLSEYGDDLFGPEKVWPWGGWPGSSPPGGGKAGCLHTHARAAARGRGRARCPAPCAVGGGALPRCQLEVLPACTSLLLKYGGSHLDVASRGPGIVFPGALSETLPS